MDSYNLKLASSRLATLRKYNPFTAEALGDVALQEQGLAYYKALSGICDALDGEPYPDYRHDPKAAIKIGKSMPANDILMMLFYSVAVYKDGLFEGDLVLPDGNTVHDVNLPLLADDDVTLLPEFTPPEYPNGTDTEIEWTEPVSELGAEMKFKFSVLCGRHIETLQAGDNENHTAQLKARQPFYEDHENPGRMLPLDMKRKDIPSWAVQAIGRKVRECDPVFNFATKVRYKGRLHTVTLFNQPAFFLRDFM